jgi:hypothetical protein
MPSIVYQIVAEIYSRPIALRNWARKRDEFKYILAAKILSREVLREKDKGNYILRRELVLPFPNEEAQEIETAYTKNGHYIGDEEIAKFLFDKVGLTKLEKARPKDNICSIGFHSGENKWYGYSHRGCVGFGIGDKIFEKNYGNDKTPYVKHGRKTIKNMKDAKISAINFAEYIA